MTAHSWMRHLAPTAVVLACALGCNADRLVGTGQFGHPLGVLTPRAYTGTIATVTIGVGPKVGSYIGELSSYSTGVTLPVGGTYVLRVAGKTHIDLNDTLFGSAPDIDVGPVLGTSGNSTALRVQLMVGDYSAFWTPTLVPGDSFSTADTIRVGYTPLTIYAKRYPVQISGSSCQFNRPDGYEGPGGCSCPTGIGTPWVACDGYEAHDIVAVTGSQTLTVDQLENDLTLTAAAATGDTGRSVTFTAHLNNGTAGNLNQFIGWAFYPDDPSKSPVATCSNGTNPCVYTVREPGRMRVMATFYNGIPTREAFAHVDAVKCPSGDSLLDRSAVRDTLKKLWDSSYASGPVNDRKERVAVILRDPSTGKVFAQQITTSYANQCRSTWMPPSPGSVAPLKVLGFAHTHPSYIGEPFNCPQDSTITEGLIGASDPDWDALQFLADSTYASMSDKPVMYVLDRDWVWRLKPNEPRGNEQNQNNYVRRTAPACQW